MMIDDPSMWWWACCSRALFIAALVAGCQEPNPRSCIDGTCTDPTLPFCDVDGALAGEPQTCIAVTCTPGELAACRGDQAITCNTEGTSYDLIQCPKGCDAVGGCRVCDPGQTVCANGKVQTCDANGTVTESEDCPLGCFEDEPRCTKLAPSNNLGEFLDMATNAPGLDYERLSFNTSTGEVRDLVNDVVLPVPSVVRSQQGAPNIRVFIVSSANIHTATIFPSSIALGPGNAFALVSHGEIVVQGPLGVAQGAGSPSLGCNAGAEQSVSNAHLYAAGSGGGGNATNGGSGGAIQNVFTKAAGGTAVGNDRIVPLQGGCPDGSRDYTGGGAIQLVSNTRIVVDGKVDIRGGRGDYDAGPAVLSLFGGGAGGSVLLEAPTVELLENALIMTKGGGGGASNVQPPSDDSSAPDPGVPCVAATCSSGGDGGTLGMPPGNAGDLSFQSGTDIFAGAGGGAMGRLRVNTATGAYVASSAALEIAAATSGSVETR